MTLSVLSFTVVLIYWLNFKQLTASEILPVPQDKPGPLIVNNQIRIVQVSPLNMLNGTFTVDLFLFQMWTLERSKCDQYSRLHNSETSRAPLVAIDGAETIIEPDTLSKIWLPRTQMFQVRTEINPGSPLVDGFLSLYTNVTTCDLKYTRRLSLTIQCDLNLRSYPYDVQNCPLDFTSAFWSSAILRYQWTDPSIVYQRINLQDNHYNINLMTDSIQDKAIDGKNRTWLTLEFVFHRKIGHYILETIVPSIFILISAYFSFYIPVESGPGRFMYTARPLFNLIILYANVKNNLPTIDYLDAEDVWILTTLFFAFTSIAIMGFCVHLKREERILSGYSRFRAVSFGSVKKQNGVLPKGSGNSSNQSSHRPSFNKSTQPKVVPAVTRKSCKCPRCRKIILLRYLHLFPCDVKPKATFSQRANQIDDFMRLAFPLAFVLFNIIYWFTLCLHNSSISKKLPHY